MAVSVYLQLRCHWMDWGRSMPAGSPITSRKRVGRPQRRGNSFRKGVAALKPRKGGDVRRVRERLRSGARFTPRSGGSAFANYILPVSGRNGLPKSTLHVKRALAQLWKTRPEVARKVAGKIGMILNFAIAREDRSTAGPASLRIMRTILGPLNQKRRHHTAMPYQQLPDSCARLRTGRGRAGARPAMAVPDGDPDRKRPVARRGRDRHAYFGRSRRAHEGGQPHQGSRLACGASGARTVHRRSRPMYSLGKAQADIRDEVCATSSARRVGSAEGRHRCTVPADFRDCARRTMLLTTW